MISIKLDFNWMERIFSMIDKHNFLLLSWALFRFHSIQSQCHLHVIRFREHCAISLSSQMQFGWTIKKTFHFKLSTSNKREKQRQSGWIKIIKKDALHSGWTGMDSIKCWIRSNISLNICSWYRLQYFIPSAPLSFPSNALLSWKSDNNL